MAATVPPSNRDSGKLDPPPDPVDSDQDAEGEEETDLYQMDQQLQDAVHRAYTGEVAEESGDDRAEAKGERGDSIDASAEGKGSDNDDAEPVGAVKLPDEEASSDSDDANSDTADADRSFENGNRSNFDPSDQESEAEEEWEAESNGRDDAERDDRSRANCIFCNQDEEHDPSDEFEVWLTCTVCGDHSHRQCAREQEAFQDTEADPWKCATCINKPDSESMETPVTQSKAGSQHLRKELLPAHSRDKGSGFHSIFDTVDVNDELLNSSRALRKRKASSIEAEEHVPVLRKRRRQTSLRSEQPDLKVPAFEVGYEAAAGNTPSLAPTRPVRSRRTRGADRENCHVVNRHFGKLVVGFRLDENKMSKILSAPCRPQQKKKKLPKPSPAVQQAQAHFAPIPPAPHAQAFHPFHDRDVDDSKSKPYGGILSETEADTSKTLPTQFDREKFELARQRAEDEWQQKVREAEQNGGATPMPSQKVSGPPSKIKHINFGGYEIETWYAAPYPEEYSRNRVLYICEFCLKYMNSDYVAWRHKLKCPSKHPPGDEIYRDASISIFEVDGRKHPVYCQNLCLLAKLFLGSKTLYYDVEPFLFYVMTEYDDLGCHFVGYFSKEKRPSSSNNVSCILTLPIHQRKGYGNLLIDFSYLLTRIEGKNGSPEKPLSDMGLVSYRNYWRLILSYQLRDLKGPVSIADLSDRTGMTADDIVSALEGLRALVRDPITKTYAFRLNHKYFQEVIDKWESKDYVQLNPDALLWTPYIMGRSNQSQFDRAPLHAVAPREGPDDEEEEEEEEEEEAEAKANVDANEAPTMNGTDADSLNEPAGPPSTNALSQANGFRPSTTPGASEPPSNPAAGIPPSRFELWPPVHVPAPVKRKPGRPFGSKSSTITPTASRTSGRNTPRRASGLGMTPSTSVRRGRSALLAEWPAVDGTPTQPNGVEMELTEYLEETVLDPNAEDKDLALDCALDVNTVPANINGHHAHDEPPETNGTVPADSGMLQTPEKTVKSPSRSPVGRKSEDRSHVPRSVSSKALVEKVQVMVSGPGSASRHDRKVDRKSDMADSNGIDGDEFSDADADAEADADFDVDGDVVMEA